ncbi:MAG: bifunctional folylpolyglutamate synthase/dihydrofolate synthase, partial [bacterium]
MNSLQGWLKKLENLDPTKIKLGLGRIDEVYQRLELDLQAVTVITVAGTNGKGSVTAMLEAGLQASGNKVACFTSPHIYTFNERIRVNNENVSDDRLVAAFERVESCRNEVDLSYFEMAALAAFVVFSEQECNYWVLEVGLGGRLDAVNVIKADIAVITSIGLDHTDWLGTDVQKISQEKLGIVHPGTILINSALNIEPSTLQPFIEKTSSHYQRVQDFDLSIQDEKLLWHGDHQNFVPKPRMQGEVQLENYSSVLKVFELLCGDRMKCFNAAAEASARVQLEGRMQVSEKYPQLMFDVAHNQDSVENLAKWIRGHKIPYNLVFGVLADKDWKGMVDQLRGLV